MRPRSRPRADAGERRRVNRLSELTLPTRSRSKADQADPRWDPSPKHTPFQFDRKGRFSLNSAVEAFSGG